ncbi:hypothetical protein [Acidiphilium sp. MT5]
MTIEIDARNPLCIPHLLLIKAKRLLERNNKNTKKYSATRKQE